MRKVEQSQSREISTATWFTMGAILVALFSWFGRLIYNESHERTFPTIRYERIDHIVGVVSRLEGYYGIVVEDQTTHEIKERSCRENGGITPCIVMKDVPPGKPLWAIYGFNKANILRETVIHVHSMQDISGGAWDQGKNGHGQTVIIAAEPATETGN